MCELAPDLRPACDFRAQSVEDNTARTKNMTKEEVIEKLKTCIQLQDPTFRERFLNISKELDGKIDMRDFRKVGDGCSVLLSSCTVRLWTH